jgi:hypothetical protein
MFSYIRLLSSHYKPFQSHHHAPITTITGRIVMGRTFHTGNNKMITGSFLLPRSKVLFMMGSSSSSSTTMPTNGGNSSTNTTTTKKTIVKKKPKPKNAPPVQYRSGIIDAQFNHDGTATLAKDEYNVPYDVHLVFVNDKHDKFYIIQVVMDKGKFITYSRWGRTATVGSVRSSGPYDTLSEAVKIFKSKFRRKTGNPYVEFVAGRFNRVVGKYDALKVPVQASVVEANRVGVNWEYEVTDRVDGKINGWYPYDMNNAQEVETVWQTWKSNTVWGYLAQRIISSKTSGYDYLVKLNEMAQKNTRTGKIRNIRRLNPGGFDLDKFWYVGEGGGGGGSSGGSSSGGNTSTSTGNSSSN